MIKVDERQLELANAFRLASIVGVFGGQVQITIREERRETKGFSRLIRAFKTHFHKTAKLMPRASDPDFQEGCFSDDEPGKPLLPLDKIADGIRVVKDIIDCLKGQMFGHTVMM